ncbi:MAG TPA: Calx-beta domain-containing protein [Ohtaekwangia sp.]|uniref:Calx-beta domain-containing protein n=1 Tax=Ohtaekwangia sp. TaxID=2066019 RepID=UPI002F922D04
MKILKFAAGALLVLLFQACSKDDNNSADTVTFTSSSQTVAESAGTIKLPLTISKAVNSSVQVYFDISGTASLNGDYEITTPSPITISAGATTASIDIQLIDDGIIESSETLVVKLTASGSGLSLSSDTTKSIYTLTITDNDTAPTSDLQVDLTWGNGGDDDINKEDLNLYITNNVVIDNGSITSFDVYAKSENTTGFETATLKSDATDGDYYIAVAYNSGSSAVNFKINLNGPGYTNSTATGSFTTSDVGHAVFYGPITKNGTSFGRVAAPEPASFYKPVVFP